MLPVSLSPFFEQYCKEEKAKLGVLGGLHRLSLAICFSVIVQWQHLSFAQLQSRDYVFVSCPQAPLPHLTYVLCRQVSFIL